MYLHEGCKWALHADDSGLTEAAARFNAAAAAAAACGGRLILNLSFRNPPQAAEDDREQNTNQNKMKREL